MNLGTKSSSLQCSDVVNVNTVPVITACYYCLTLFRLVDHPELQNVARTLAFNTRLANQMQSQDASLVSQLKANIADLSAVVRCMCDL